MCQWTQTQRAVLGTIVTTLVCISGSGCISSSRISVRFPSFAPDGDTVLVVGTSQGVQALYSVRRDGGGLRQLTRPFGAYDTDPVPSQDGSTVLFVTGEKKDSPPDLCVTDPAGEMPRYLTTGGTGGFSPAWSTDGQTVYFISENGAGDEDTYDLYSVRSSGQGRQRVTHCRDFFMRSLSASQERRCLVVERWRHESTNSIWRIQMSGETNFVPADDAGDAAHLAIASYHAVDYLLTWNCRHLAMDVCGSHRCVFITVLFCGLQV